MKLKVLPYAMSSRSSKEIARHFDPLRIQCDRKKTKYKPREDHVILNWGYNGEPHPWMSRVSFGRFINAPHAVNFASNKLFCLERLSEREVDSVDYTTQREVAREWIDQGFDVYCRQLTRGSQGRGIVVAHTADEIVSAPLYTKGVQAIKREYRAHVFNGEVIDLVAKATRAGEDNANMEIRNHSNGWVFVRDAVTIPEATRQQLVALAVDAVQAVDLQLGAVDIIRDEADRLYVLEINTAPGLEGTTLERYVTELRNYVECLG